MCKVGVCCLFFSAVTFHVYWSAKEIKANASKAKKRLKYLTLICKDIHICGEKEWFTSLSTELIRHDNKSVLMSDHVRKAWKHKPALNLTAVNQNDLIRLNFLELPPNHPNPTVATNIHLQRLCSFMTMLLLNIVLLTRVARLYSIDS